MSATIITYAIDRWDAVIPPTKSIPAPMIYVKADDKLKNHWRREVAVRFQNTGSPYDNLMTTAHVYSSNEFPNPRPNFFEATGLYVLYIDMPWLRYPSANGTVDILLDSVIPPVEAVKEGYFQRYATPCQKVVEGGEEEHEEHGMNSNQIGFLLIGLVIIFITLFWISLES